MRDLLPTLLPRIERHRLNGLDAGPDTIYPYYDGLSLVNIPASVCHWLGAPANNSARPLTADILELYPRTFQHVILLVVDGMGLNTMQQALRLAESDADYAVWGDLAADGALAPLTSIVPSTTAAALTSLWTGVAPAAHGVVGYEVWLKEYGMIANMIYHSPASFTGDIGSLQKSGFDPKNFLPTPTLGPHLVRQGVKPYAFQHMAIARSGLSTMLQPGVEVMPFRSQSDLWVTLDTLLDSTENERNYMYIYWGDLDEHSHRFGPQDPRVSLELTSFSRQLAYIIRKRRARGRQDTLLLVTADHGHIFTPQQPEYELRNHPALNDMLVMLPSGEARLPFAYLRPGREADFQSYLQTAWDGQFLAAPSQLAIQAGLFGEGEVYARLPERVGDFVILPRAPAYWWFGSRDNPLLGRHGGLSRVEMLTPLLSCVL